MKSDLSRSLSVLFYCACAVLVGGWALVCGISNWCGLKVMCDYAYINSSVAEFFFPV